MDDEVHDILNRSLEAIENNTTTHTHDEYEVIAHVPKLPDRKDYPRGRPLSADQWKGLKDPEGRVEDVESVRLMIFRGVRQFNAYNIKFLIMNLILGNIARNS